MAIGTSPTQRLHRARAGRGADSARPPPARADSRRPAARARPCSRACSSTRRARRARARARHGEDHAMAIGTSPTQRLRRARAGRGAGSARPPPARADSRRPAARARPCSRAHSSARLVRRALARTCHSEEHSVAAPGSMPGAALSLLRGTGRRGAVPVPPPAPPARSPCTMVWRLAELSGRVGGVGAPAPPAGTTTPWGHACTLAGGVASFVRISVGCGGLDARARPRTRAPAPQWCGSAAPGRIGARRSHTFTGGHVAGSINFFGDRAGGVLGAANSRERHARAWRGLVVVIGVAAPCRRRAVAKWAVPAALVRPRRHPRGHRHAVHCMRRTAHV